MAAPDALRLLDRVIPAKVAAGLLGVPRSIFAGIDPAKLTLARAFRAARRAALTEAQATKEARRAPIRAAKAEARRVMRLVAARADAGMRAEALAAAATARLAGLLADDLEAVAERLASVDPEAGRIARQMPSSR